jgi:hypothetical protein
VADSASSNSGTDRVRTVHTETPDSPVTSVSRQAPAIALALIVVLVAGCGDGAPRPDATLRREVVAKWVSALNARDWSRACSLMANARAACAQDQRQTFANTKASISPAFSLVNNGRPNDNKRTFAVTARKPDGSSIATLLDVPKVSRNYKIKPIATLLPAN